MRTVGIDLAAAAANTAVAVVDWAALVVEPAVVGVSDDALVDAALAGDRVGIDCPIGWPVEFVRAVSAYERREPWPGRDEPDRAAYTRRLRFRRTDLVVQERTGRWPLSVSTDRLGVTATRCAWLLDRAETLLGERVDRRGTGRFAEVYPALSRRVWGLSTARDVEELRARLPALSFVDAAGYSANEHAFDALVASLVARAVALDLTHEPEPADLELAAVEGWIRLPYPDALDRLVD